MIVKKVDSNLIDIPLTHSPTTYMMTYTFMAPHPPTSSMMDTHTLIALLSTHNIQTLMAIPTTHNISWWRIHVCIWCPLLYQNQIMMEADTLRTSHFPTVGMLMVIKVWVFHVSHMLNMAACFELNYFEAKFQNSLGFKLFLEFEYIYKSLVLYQSSKEQCTINSASNTK